MRWAVVAGWTPKSLNRCTMASGLEAQGAQKPAQLWAALQMVEGDRDWQLRSLGAAVPVTHSRSRSPPNPEAHRCSLSLHSSGFRSWLHMGIA